MGIEAAGFGPIAYSVSSDHLFACAAAMRMPSWGRHILRAMHNVKPRCNKDAVGNAPTSNNSLE